MAIDNFLCTIAIDYFLCSIVTMIVTTIIHYFHKTCCGQTDQMADIVIYRAAFAAKDAKYECKMQKITTECSNIIKYNNSNNNCTLTTR